MNPNKAQNLDKSYKENISQFWEGLYQTNDDKWDLKEATPIFKKLATELPLGRVCIIGCGRGYDAIAFAEKGFHVTAIDFAPSPISSLKNMANLMGVSLEIIRKDIFDLLPEYHDSFDYVLEQTCFCAIHPSRRKEYENIVKGILKIGGHLVGLWFPLDKDIEEEGPPYGTTIEEVKSTFDSGWGIIKEEFSEYSIKPRKGREKLVVFKRIGSGNE
tara:strand:+ start:1016 stop:1663 length:648 start_codon:yes stop_codon:yes gene_type:complete